MATQTQPPKIGIDVVYPDPNEGCASKTSIKVDIVAIPGLGPREDWGWTLNKTHWLKNASMLAKKISGARISVFNYDTNSSNQSSINHRLESIGEELLQGLNRIRRSTNPQVPIIFICHSLGGVVLEKALLTSQLRQANFPSIYPYVAGAVFLGTPFTPIKGAQATILGQEAEKVSRIAADNWRKWLADEPESLQSLTYEFSMLAEEAQMRLFCFFERHETTIETNMKDLTPRSQQLVKTMFPKKRGLLVNESAVTMNGVVKQGLSTSHLNLNKFEGSKDINFICVSDEISKIVQKAPSILKSRQRTLRQALVDDRTYQSMRDNLSKGFQNIDAAIRGEKNIGASKAVLDLGPFKEWESAEEPSILWVHGKAGTGQDAIASSALDLLKNSPQSGNLLTSFYCDQSDKERRSLQGLLRIVVRQIIDAEQDFATYLLSDSRDANKQDFYPEVTLKERVLWDAIFSMAKDLPNGFIYIVINGLEQLKEESLSQFLELISEFSDALKVKSGSNGVAPVKWLLLSRTGRPNIGRTLKSRAYELNLEDAESMKQISLSLRANISTRVEELDLPSSLAYFVKRHIHSRAEDNEIYVKLVIQEVKNAWKPGKTHHAEIRTLLESFPYGLTNMFEHIRNRVLDPKAPKFEYIKEILRCRICAWVAPTLQEIAIMAGVPGKDREDYDLLREYILQCGGFLTMEEGYWDATVDWIDPSAQKYLRENAKDVLALDLEDMQHGIIALRSLEYIYNAVDHKPDDEGMAESDTANEFGDDDNISEFRSDRGDDIEDNDADSVPTNTLDGDANEHREDEISGNSDLDKLFKDTLEYPVHYWVEHAKRAPADVLEDFHLDHSFWQNYSEPREEWWKVLNENDQTELSALHIAVILRYRALVDYILEHRDADGISHDDSKGFQPLYYACGGGDEDIVDALLGTAADINYPGDNSRPTALHAAADNGRIEIVKSLVDRQVDLDATSESHGTALYAAVANHNNDVVEFLLEKNANVNVLGGDNKRALNVAAMKGNLRGVQMLLDHGADVDPEEEYWYGSALGAAARMGHLEIVKLLLSKGWDPNRPMKTYKTMLTAAATYNHAKIFDILLEKEGRVSALEQALDAAAQRGFAPIAQAVLDRAQKLGVTIRCQKAFTLAASFGRDEVLKLFFGRDISQEQLDNALYKATDNEREETVRLLLDHGADPNSEGPTYGFALAASAFDGTKEILEALLAKGADVNKRNANSQYGTAIQAAAFRGDAENVKLLIDHGALLNTEPIGYYGNELQAACFTGDDDTIRLLLEHGANVNAYGGHYNYPIVAAVSEADSSAMQILLEHNANANVRGGENNWPLISLAASYLRKEDLQLIVNRISDINVVCDKGTTALINCANALDTEGVQFLLDNDADVHIISESKGSALHAAAENGDEHTCKVLLEAGADVNQIGGPYGTCLQAAAFAQDLDTVRVLLDAGAEVNAPSCGEHGTAVIAACVYGSIDVVKELLKAGAAINPGSVSEQYGSALTVAAANGYEDLVALLIDNQADINFEGGFHGFPIMAAACSGKLSIVKKLLDHQANIYIHGKNWGSPIIAAVHAKCIDIIEMLVEYGADVHQQGGIYQTALQAAAIDAEDSIIDYLMHHAPELVTVIGGKYHTALIAASYFGHTDLVKRLLDATADFRIQGGKYRSAITAAAIRGNKAVLDVFLEKRPPRALLNEALVEACAHRQSISVDVLIKAGADIRTRHTTLGTAHDALNAPQADDENSDIESDEEDEDGIDDNDEENEDDDNTEEVDSDEEDDTGSVTDLQLEDDTSEEDKIRALLDDPTARLMRNGTVKRYRTVRQPRSFAGYGIDATAPPVPGYPLPDRGEIERTYNPVQPAQPLGHSSMNHFQQPWTPAIPSQPHSEPWTSPPIQQQPVTQQQRITSPNMQDVNYAVYPQTLVPRKQVPSQSGYPIQVSSAQQVHPGEIPVSRPQLEGQYSGSPDPAPRGMFIESSGSSSGDNGLRRQSVINRKSMASPGLAERYQQRQSSYSKLQGPIEQTPARQDFNHSTPSPPIANYGAYQPPSLPHQQYSTPPNPQPQNPNHPPGALYNASQPPQPATQYAQPHYVPYNAPPLVQQSGYTPYSPPATQTSSQMPLQNNQFAHDASARYQPQLSWNNTPNSHNNNGIVGHASQQNMRWRTGGYEGEGYG